MVIDSQIENKRIVIIEYIRIISIFCVILFHALGIITGKEIIPNSYDLSILRKISGHLVGIAVPFFLFIAGYLYRKPLPGGKTSFILKKAKRLLLPYPIFTVLTMLASGYFDATELYTGGFWHLWFLTSLFWCFVISVYIDYSSKWIWFLIPISLGLSLVRLPSFLGVQDFVEWYYYFAIGAIVKCHRINISHKWIVSIACICVYIVVIWIFPFHYRERSIIHAIAISALIYGIWILIKDLKLKLNRVVCLLGQCSMGIYILHYIVLIYLLSSISFRIFHISTLLQAYPIITILGLSIIAYIISFLSTMLLRTSKWTRALIGG